MRGILSVLMRKKAVKTAGVILAILYLISNFFSLMTVNYYHMFAHLDSYSWVMVVFQWLKLTAMLVLPLGVFQGRATWKRIIRWLYLPLAIGLLCLTDTYMTTAEIASSASDIYFAVNCFLPDPVIRILYCTEAVLLLLLCLLQWVEQPKEGIKGRDLGKFALVCLAVTPLNLLDNFARMLPEKVHAFLLFRNFSIWHIAALLVLLISVWVNYRILQTKDRERQEYALQLLAIVAMIHYSSKMSVVIGDGYNVYDTLFACIPLFICNIGEFVATAAVFLKKKRLYDIAFFVHAVGALSVFVYFGRDDMSNFGTVLNYSFLYFVATHLFLFHLCLLPILLKHHEFRLSRCGVPLLYYAIVILAATAASVLVTNYSAALCDSLGVGTAEWLYPNYAFTQINPLPVEIPPLLSLRIGVTEVNVLYVVLVYIAYLILFFSFYFLQKILGILFRFLKKEKSSV